MSPPPSALSSPPPRAPWSSGRGSGSSDAAEAAREAAPYVGIVAVCAVATGVAVMALRRRVATLLREGRTEDSLLEERLLLSPALLR
jgi:hypothetical protein